MTEFYNYNKITGHICSSLISILYFLATLMTTYDFHEKILRSTVLVCLETKDKAGAFRAYSQYFRLYTNVSVAKDLLSFGFRLIETFISPEDQNAEKKTLLGNLVSLKGRFLKEHLQVLCELLVSDNQVQEAEALIKSKLSPTEADNMLKSLIILP